MLGRYEGMTRAQIHSDRPNWNLWRRDGAPDTGAQLPLSPASISALGHEHDDRALALGNETE